MPYPYGIAIVSREDPLRAGETDFRSRSFTDDLQPWGDTIVLASPIVTITRRDGAAITANDLQLVGAVMLDYTETVPQFDLHAPSAAAGVDYIVTVQVTTAQGRTLIRDAYLMVVQTFG